MWAGSVVLQAWGRLRSALLGRSEEALVNPLNTGHPFSCNRTWPSLWEHQHNLTSPFAKPKANRAHTPAKQYCSGKSHWTSASKDTKREGKSYWGPFFPHIPFMSGSKDLIYRCFRNHSWISAVWAGTERSLVLQQHIKHSCVSALQSRDTPVFSVVLKCFIVSWSLTMQSKQENTDSTTETQQQGNSMKFRATEDKRKFLKELTWIIVYYLFTDIFKTYILLLHSQSTVVLYLKAHRFKENKEQKSPLSLTRKTHSFLIWFSAGPSPELTHSEVRQVPVGHGKCRVPQVGR